MPSSKYIVSHAVLSEDGLWKDVPGFSGYRVRNDGTVWSCRTTHGELSNRWHSLGGSLDQDGYLSVVLCDKGERTRVRFAHLVLEAFIGPRPDKCESCHFPDSDPLNNRVENLRWAPHIDNIQDKVILDTMAKGEGHGNSKLTDSLVIEMRHLRQRGVSYAELGQRFGVSKHQAWLVATRRNWKHVA